MKRVVLESPYAGNINLNVEYARACVRDSLRRGESPIASHLLYTQDGILKDNVPQDRSMGILAGFAWLEKGVAEGHVFYIDLGWSNGMRRAYDVSLQNGFKPELRKILGGEF